MNLVRSEEYEYVRTLVFFGFMCGITFSAAVVILMHWITSKGDHYE